MGEDREKISIVRKIIRDKDVVVYWVRYRE